MLPAILVVDDDPLVRWSLGQALARRGLRVLEAGSAAEAGLVSRAESLAVAVLDWSLPDGDGLALVPRLRAASPRVRLLLLTAWHSEELAARAAAAGVRVLAKPYEVEDVVRQVVAEAQAWIRMPA